MFGNLHFYEIVLVIVVIVIVFGGKRLPELGKGLGKGLRNFRRGLAGKDDLETDSPAGSAAGTGQSGQTNPASQASQADQTGPAAPKPGAPRD
ncbi:MAG: twin-arginine translocase TatA/TatE family subunit [Deltaproteobacteria bacterium]|jgi:sec-independent protein translocase protein TatA|nr:twin-arginine translocase TatA/TatE family subunit [Deltaproteobacteria bacterium]